MKRRGAQWWLSALVVLGACSGGSGTSSDTATDPSAVDTTAPGSSVPADAPADLTVPEGYQRFIDETQGATPDPQQTLDWVVSATGLAIPGATDTYGDLVGRVGSFTGEIEWLTTHWRSFTAEQQAALKAAFARPTEASSGLLARRPSDVEDDARALVQELLPSVRATTGVAVDALAVSVREIPQVQLETALAGTNPASLDEGFVPEEGRDWLGGDPMGYCDIMVGSLFATASRAAQRGALAHELVHCAVLQHHEYSPPVTPKWWDEGGTAYAGEVIATDSRLGFGPSWWAEFFGGNAQDARGRRAYSFMADTRGYSAIGLFAWAGEQRGAQTLVQEWVRRFADPARLDWLLGGAAGSAGRAAGLASYAMAAVRAPWGPRWTMQGVNLANHGMAGRGRTQVPVSVLPNASQAVSLGSGARDVAAALRLDPAPSVDLLAVQLVGYGGVTAQGRGELIATGAPVTQVFCIGPACECSDQIAELAATTPVAIDRGVSPVVAIAGDVGAGPVVGTLGYDLPDDGTCNPCPAAVSSGLIGAPAQGDFDPICAPADTVPVTEPPPGDSGCLVGTWAVDAEMMVAVFSAADTGEASEGPTEYQVSGSWTMTLGADGSLTTVIENWTLTYDFFGPGGLGSEEPVPISFTLVFNGAVGGRWSASGSTMTVSGAAGTIAATATGEVMGQTFDVTTPQMQNLSIGTNGASTFTCSANRLTLTPQVAGGLPLHFVR